MLFTTIRASLLSSTTKTVRVIKPIPQKERAGFSADRPVPTSINVDAHLVPTTIKAKLRYGIMQSRAPVFHRNVALR
jgi:hypothetical protein